MQNTDDQIRATGLSAVRAAATLCEAVRAAMVVAAAPDTMDKQDRSPVTVADFGAQALVCRLLHQHFPHDAIVAEEDSVALQEASHAEHLTAVTAFVKQQVQEATPDDVVRWIDKGSGVPGNRFWVLDPIDGTKGFLRQDQYAIALALIADGSVRYGFLACPVLRHGTSTGVIFVARQGGGTEVFALDGTALGMVRVNETTNPAEARLAESVETAHTNRGLSWELQQTLGISAEPVRMDSQAKYAAVARGDADIYLRAPNSRTPDYRECIWDHAAGWLVITEAGGQVTDVYGNALDWTQGRRLQRNIGIVATNGYLHSDVLEAIRPHLQPAETTWEHQPET
jgi:3'(2'), 5'-bisphosphate nucleotidase